MALDWHVASTKHNQEIKADVCLRRQGFETFFPRVRERTGRGYRVRPYLPRYIFVRFDRERDAWGRINSTRGVSRLFTSGDFPSRIRRGVIEAMIESAENGSFVTDDRMREIIFSAGDRVRVRSGPFSGKAGKVVSVHTEDEIVRIMLDDAQFGGLRIKRSPVRFGYADIEPA